MSRNPFRFRHDHVLGTVVEVGVDTDSAAHAERVDRAIVETIRRLEKTFSIFDPASEICQYRQRGTTTNADLRTVIELARHWQRRSDGAFNPATAQLQELWTNAAAAGVAPTPAELSLVVDNLDGATQTAHLNLNAIAKGWIADRAIEPVMGTSDLKPRAVWLSIGGDLVHRGAGSIRVGIEHPGRPYDNAAPLAVTEVGNQALATSGNSRRFVDVNGITYGHVVDPRTGLPNQHIASATVLALDACTADVLATIAVVCEPDESLALIEDTPHAACLLVQADHSFVTSDRWPSDDRHPDQNRGDHRTRCGQAQAADAPFAHEELNRQPTHTDQHE